MSILLDGIIFSLQRHGGISVYFKNLIKALVEEGVQHTVLLYSERLQSLSPTEHVSDVKFEASRVFERIRNCRLKVDPQVFHSSYYRLPEIKKVPSVVTVHDFVNEKLEDTLGHHFYDCLIVLNLPPKYVKFGDQNKTRLSVIN